MDEVREGSFVPFDAAAQVLALMENTDIGVEVIDPEGTVSMLAFGPVQCVEFSSESKAELIVHGTGWDFAVDRETDRVVLDGGDVIVRRRGGVQISISPEKRLGLSPNGARA